MADVLSQRPSDFVEDEMERTMRKFFGRPLFSASGEGFWHPPADIHITDKSVIVRIDIPGIDPKEVEISIEDNRLLVRGKRTPCEEAAINEQCWYNETRRGDFHRVIDLPEYVDSAKAAASGENGVLTIEMPKKKEAKSKVIKVKTK
ncbi:MAG: Hsp20/alpha crystallin family protein [Planctomycetota bacterium]